jgi:hypothetical protein
MQRPYYRFFDKSVNNDDPRLQEAFGPAIGSIAIEKKNPFLFFPFGVNLLSCWETNNVEAAMKAISKQLRLFIFSKIFKTLRQHKNSCSNVGIS